MPSVRREKKKKIGFWAKKSEPVEAMTNRLNWLRYQSIDYTFLVEFWSRDAKNLLSLSVAFLFRSGNMSSRSRFGQGLTVTYHAFNAQRLVNQSTPNLIDWGCFLAFWLSTLETYKLRAPLHLWAGVPCIYLFTYLFLPQKLSFFLWCIKPSFAYSLMYPCDSS